MGLRLGLHLQVEVDMRFYQWLLTRIMLRAGLILDHYTVSSKQAFRKKYEFSFTTVVIAVGLYPLGQIGLSFVLLIRIQPYW